METRLILRLMARRWWLFLIVLLVTVGTTLFLTMRQTPIYRAKATYITRLSTEITDAKTISTALDTLNRYDDFQGTYSEIAMSQMIKRQAGRKLGITGSDLRNLSVSSRTVPGSKILEISVEGQDPQLIRDFAGVVGEETMAYVNNLYPSYELTLLDSPTTPNNPISPRLPFNLVLGAVLGGFLGVAALLLSSWLRGDFKNTSPIPSDPEEASPLLPVRKELEVLLQQCELLRVELDETRKMIHATKSQAKTIRAILNSLPKNGSSHEKMVIHMEEEDETGYLEDKSPSR